MRPGLLHAGVSVGSAMEQVLEFNAALELILLQAESATRPLEETVPLLAAHGRTLAQPVLADRDQPPFNRSTRDGFAVKAGSPGERAIVGLLRAGERWTGADLLPEQAIEIMTGAPVPRGADAVLMVEHAVLRGDDRLGFTDERTPAAGQNIVPRGSELRVGAVALSRGTRLGAAEIALAASLGAARASVFRRPRVAILATGDELVEVEEMPDTQQIRNSNSYALAALVADAGGEAVQLPIVRDHLEALTRALSEARRCDLIVLSGGVSMGKYDLVEQALAHAGAAFLFTGVRMQPGKPVVFGTLSAGEGREPAFFFGLPGNPISTQVTFLCFVAPLLRAIGGQADRAPLFAQARLAEAVPARPGLTRLLPARLLPAPDAPSVRLVPWKGSGDLQANARANCYALLPADHAEDFAADEAISILLR